MPTEIITKVQDWLRRIDIPCEVLTERPDALRVILETEHALAELVVGEPDCAPRRYVSFTVLDTRLDPKADPVFCFHDDESCTIPDILRELDRGEACIRTLR